MKDKTKLFIMASVTAILFLVAIIPSLNIIGVPKAKLEKDARKSHKIEDTFHTAKAIDENIGAFLFYDENLEDFTFSIYVKGDAPSLGYFYRNGGGLPGIFYNIQQFDFDGKSSVLMSLNKLKIAKIKLDLGSNATEVIKVDPLKPFSIIIPENTYEFYLYDSNDKLIPLEDKFIDKI